MTFADIDLENMALAELLALQDGVETELNARRYKGEPGKAPSLRRQLAHASREIAGQARRIAALAKRVADDNDQGRLF